MLTPLLSMLVLLAQAPASGAAPAAPSPPLVVLVAPPDAAGVSPDLLDFSQEHIAAQLQSRELRVVRTREALKKLPATRRRRLLHCIQTERRCLQSLGDSARAEVVLVAELMQMTSDYRVGAKVYTTKNGALVAEHLISGVSEAGMLEALTQALDVVVPQVRRTLRPGSVPEPEPTPVVKGPPVEPPPAVKPPPAKPLAVTPTPMARVEQPAPGGSGLRPWAWAPAAGGLLFAGAGTWWLLEARSSHQQLATEGSATARLDGEALRGQGERAQTLSRVAFGLGAVGVVTGALFYLLPGESAPPVRPTVSAGPRGAMVGLSGTLP